jgi:hypothetical protein
VHVLSMHGAVLPTQWLGLKGFVCPSSRVKGKAPKWDHGFGYQREREGLS